mgnify:CR=1 FL=1
MLQDKLSRRKFFSISFGSLIIYTLLACNKTKSNIEISKELREKILNHYDSRKAFLGKDIDSAISDDMINNKTTWIGKKLYTYSELFSLI